MKIKISVSAYNEIATTLERLGVKADGTTELTLEKGTQLSCPIDFKMVTIRRDIADIATRSYNSDSGISLVEHCKQLAEWILSENEYSASLTSKPKGWK